MTEFKPFPFQQGMGAHLQQHPHAALFSGLGLGRTPCTLTAYADMIARGEMTGACLHSDLARSGGTVGLRLEGRPDEN